MFCIVSIDSSTASIATRDINFNTVRAENDLAKLLRAKFDQHNLDIAGLANLGTGKVFYVDSNAGGSSASVGTTPASAAPTLDAGINLCTASRGDIIFVMQGHAETWTAQDADADVIGITIIGLGNGSLRPTITFSDTDAELAIGADNVTIRNMRFVCSVTGVLMGIEVEDGVDWFCISGCEFTSAGDAVGTDEFVEAINFVNDNTSCSIIGNSFNAEAAGAAHAIFCDADTSRLSIVDNDIRGDYSVACIGGDTTASTDLLIQNNILINGALVGDGGLNAVAAISMLDASAGVVMGNYIGSDVATALLMTVFDDGLFMGDNYVADTDGDEFGGGTKPIAASVTIFVDGG